MKHRAPRSRHAGAAIPLAVAVALAASAPPALAADPTAPEMCGVLKQVLPQVKGFKPEGARAQLVMAFAEKYDADAKQLRLVRAQIDKAATASCPKEREAMLGIVKMKTLAEALG